jgi:hypothetical protein
VNSTENALATALRERLRIIADRDWYTRDSESHLHALQAVSENILALASQLPPPVDPQLAHFLQRCSYDKALAFLEFGQSAH